MTTPGRINSPYFKQPIYEQRQPTQSLLHSGCSCTVTLIATLEGSVLVQPEWAGLLPFDRYLTNSVAQAMLLIGLDQERATRQETVDDGPNE